MGDNNVVLYFSLVEFIDFPVGSYIIFTDTSEGVITESERYTMLEIGQVTKISERQYDYVLTFESSQFVLNRYKFRNTVDGRLNFTLTAQPQEFIKHIVYNLNGYGRDSGWTVGACIESTEKTQSFSHNTIIEALNSVASLFETEWEIDSANKRIHLRKTEYFKDSPLSLSYGKGNGFKSGISRQKGQENAIDVLYVEGGDRNIDSSTYTYEKVIEGQTQKLHANKLRLPKSQMFYYKPDTSEDGTGKGFVYPAKEIANTFMFREQSEYIEFIKDAMIVTTDEDGFGIFRKDKLNFGLEESLELTEIYPKKELKITAVTLEDKDNRFWNITVGQNEVNYNNVIIDGTNPTVIFQDGMLEGKEFEFSNYNHDTKTFKLVPQAIDGIVMPDLAIDDRDSKGAYGTGYIPAVGQTVAVFHINLPQKYIEDAEKEMLLEACQYLYKHGEVEVEFTGTMDGIWSRKSWESIRPHIRLGGMIRFYDNALCQEGKDIRIIGIKDFLNNPHAPEITLSNTTIQQGVSSTLKKIAQNEVFTQTQIEQEHYTQIRYTSHTFTETQKIIQELSEETAAKIDENAEMFWANYDDGISPVSVETMKLLSGDKSLQYEFGFAYDKNGALCQNNTEVSKWTKTEFLPTMDDNRFHNAQIHIKHKAYMEANGTSANRYPYWYIKESTQDIASQYDGKKLYIYIQANRKGTNSGNLDKLTGDENNPYAEFVLSPELKENTLTFYYFLYGILDCNRNISSMYGFTEVSGNNITSGVLKSETGETYFDLDHNVIGGNMNIKDGTIQSELILGSSRSPNAGGLSYKNIIDKTQRAVFNGKEVAMWLGSESYFNPYSSNNLICNKIKFYKDGSFDLSNAIHCDPNSAFDSNIHLNKPTAIDGALSVDGMCYIDGNLTVVDSAQLGWTGKENHTICGTINSIKASGGKTFRGVIPTLMFYGWIESKGFRERKGVKPARDIYYANYIHYYVNAFGISDSTSRDALRITSWSNDTGKVKVQLPYYCESSNFIIMPFVKLTDSKDQGYACYEELSDNSGWYIYIADDASRNDFDFYLQIWQLRAV